MTCAGAAAGVASSRQVAAEALRVEGLELRRVLIGRARKLEHLGRAPVPAEGRERRGVAPAAVGRDRIRKRPIAGVEVDVHIRRRLVEHLLDAHRLLLGAPVSGRACIDNANSSPFQPGVGSQNIHNCVGGSARAPLRGAAAGLIDTALMNIAPKPTFVLNQRHLLGIEGLSREEILGLLDLAENFVELNRQIDKKQVSLRGRTLINLFFEVSTRTQASFELAGKRLGADVMNMSVGSSSMRKGETLIDTAITLNAMHPDIIVVRHHASGAVELLAKKVDCSVINAGDGSHEHPTQALLDALTIRRNKGRIGQLIVAICGDILHSRVARSNIILLNAMGARVRVVAPSTLLPPGIERFGVEVARDMREGLADADIVMMLRLQRERMNGS